MKTIFLIFIIFANVAILATGTPPPAGTRPILENFPEAQPEAIYKNVEKKYTFSEDGECEFRCKSELLVNTLFAMNELCGETFIIYNPKNQRVKVHAAYTIMADGTRVDVPENAFNEVLPKAAENAPVFNFLRELVITHTALEPGATIFLDYSIFYDSVINRKFDEFSDMPFPCENLIFNFNGEITEFSNVPARSREKFYSPRKNLPVIYSGMPAGKKIDFNAQKLFLSEPNKKNVEQIAPKTMTRIERIFALQKFVQEKIATIPISMESLDFPLRLPDSVMESAYGVPAEKALLLKAMLLEIGENPEIEHAELPEIFSLKVAELKSKLFADAENTRRTIDEKLALNVEISPAEEKFSGTIISGGLTTEAAGKSAALKNYAVDEKTLTQPASVFLSEYGDSGATVNFSAKRAIVPIAGDAIVWEIPNAANGVATLGLDKLPSMRFSRLTLPGLEGAIQESVSVKIRLAPGVEFCAAGTPVALSNECGSVSFFVQRDGEDLLVEKKLFLKKTSVPAQDYPQFRELLVAWFSPATRRLLFVIKAE